MEDAIKLGRYFLNHAQSVYNVLPVNAMYNEAEKILDMIVKKGLTQFDRRQAMRSCSSFKTVTAIQPVLDFLEDYGYIVQITQKATGSGRPPLPKYAVNPHTKEVFCHSVRHLSEDIFNENKVGKH